MISKLGRAFLATVLLLSALFAIAGCAALSETSATEKLTLKGEVPKIGVSFGVGEAQRWVLERGYMEARAKELGVDIEVRFNKTDEPKTQKDDCIELIDQGIDVLIFIPRDVNKVSEILDYAKQEKVPVINYARTILGQEVDLFVGNDSGRMGQVMGQYLAEIVYRGDYIILQGDPKDGNATLLYEGAMRFIDPIKDDIRIILDAPVPGWSSDEAKRMVKEAVAANGNKVDAIFAPNDKLAGASRAALDELGVTTPVVITGMDAELDAVQRIVAGTQSSTMYMDLRELSVKAVDEAYRVVQGQPLEVNAEYNNKTGEGIKAYLITGKLITKENIDKLLIETGHFTKDQVYNPPSPN